VTERIERAVVGRDGLAGPGVGLATGALMRQLRCKPVGVVDRGAGERLTLRRIGEGKRSWPPGVGRAKGGGDIGVGALEAECA
jgi:hypothetical protein